MKRPFASLLFVLFIAFFLSLSPLQAHHVDPLEVVIEKTSSQQEIDQLIDDLSDRGYKLKMKKLRYNNRGLISFIEGSIKTPEGTCGSFSAGPEFSRVWLQLDQRDKSMLRIAVF